MNPGSGRACFVLACVLVLAGPSSVVAQRSAEGSGGTPPEEPTHTTGLPPPADYLIGPDDVLSVLFWQEKDLSAEVVVRPDGHITLPLLNDLKASGLTPEQLRVRVIEEARQYIEEPNATVIVKEVNSRKVFITGEIQKPGAYALTGSTTVLQLIATAGGLTEYANSKNILIMRMVNGQQATYRFNYREILGRRNFHQNIELKPGDTIIVP